MAVCEYCGRRFKREEEEDSFFNITYSYSNFTIPLCADCAMQAIEDRVDGIINETCECCGKIFDPMSEDTLFQTNFDWSNGTELSDYWDDYGIVCAACALDKIKENNY